MPVAAQLVFSFPIRPPRTVFSRIELMIQLVYGQGAMLAFYSREESWAQVGYDGPWLGRVDVPVLPAQDLSAPSIQEGRGFSIQPPSLPSGVTSGTLFQSDQHLRAQVCVIGTGAGGAAALARLAEKGLDVIALETGRQLQAVDFTQRESEMLPLLFAEAGLRATSDKSIGILRAPLLSWAPALPSRSKRGADCLSQC